MADETVRDGLVVGIDYKMALASGEAIDSTEGEPPLEILQGAGEVLPGLEEALYGMRIGDHKTVVLSPAQAFGEDDGEDRRITLPRDEFPDDVEWEKGMEIFVQTEDDEDPESAYIVDLGPDEVLVDFNHPLAGKAVQVDVTVRTLRAATPEELAHGHAHGEGTEHANGWGEDEDDDDWDFELDDESGEEGDDEELG